MKAVICHANTLDIALPIRPVPTSRRAHTKDDERALKHAHTSACYRRGVTHNSQPEHATYRRVGIHTHTHTLVH